MSGSMSAVPVREVELATEAASTRAQLDAIRNAHATQVQMHQAHQLQTTALYERLLTQQAQSMQREASVWQHANSQQMHMAQSHAALQFQQNAWAVQNSNTMHAYQLRMMTTNTAVASAGAGGHAEILNQQHLTAMPQLEALPPAPLAAPLALPPLPPPPVMALPAAAPLESAAALPGPAPPGALLALPPAAAPDTAPGAGAGAP